MVLIETYWNVNLEVQELFGYDSNVLIETYWNVNDFKNISRIVEILY